MRLLTMITALAWALLLGACAGTPLQVSPSTVALVAASSAKKPTVGMFGSLATSPCEVATAAPYTAAWLMGRKLERLLVENKVTAKQALPLVETAQGALQLLDGACIDRNTVDPVLLALAGKRVVELSRQMEALDADAK